MSKPTKGQLRAAVKYLIEQYPGYRTYYDDYITTVQIMNQDRPIMTASVRYNPTDIYEGLFYDAEMGKQLARMRAYRKLAHHMLVRGKLVVLIVPGAVYRDTLVAHEVSP